jgi:tripartite-type tricarboxylate transporter receptor subunit TctC
MASLMIPGPPSPLSRRALLAVPGLAWAAARANAAGWAPERPVRWVVGYPPGGGSDLMARLLAQAVAAKLGQPVAVENRPGAGAVVASELVALAPADGHMLLTGDNGSLVFNPFLYLRLPYDPVRAFRPVGGLARFPLLVLVPAGSPVRDLPGLAARAKEQGALSYGSSGTGSPQHLAAARLLRQAGIEGTHIPHRGGAAVLNDLIAGRVELALLDSAAALAQVREGRIRPIAAAGAERLPALPEVPTAAEQGLQGYAAQAWQGLVVHAATSDAVVARLAAVLQAALAEEAVTRRLADGGVEPWPIGPEAFGALLEQERAVWGPLIRGLGLQLDL